MDKVKKIAAYIILYTLITTFFYGIAGWRGIVYGYGFLGVVKLVTWCLETIE